MPLVKQSLWTSCFSKTHFVIPLFGGKLRGDIAVAEGKDLDNGQRSPPSDSLSKTQSLTAAGKHKTLTGQGQGQQWMMATTTTIQSRT